MLNLRADMSDARMDFRRILVCGGRDFGDYTLLADTLEKFVQEGSQYYHRSYKVHEWNPFDIVIIHGACPTGADELANQWAISRRCMIERYPAQWVTHGSFAGHVRNVRMLHSGKPECVVAFEGRNGTAHMKRIARAARVPVFEIPSRKQS
jgi:hypothetical protein